MRFDDDDGLDEEADFELQTLLFISDTFGHLFAVVCTRRNNPRSSRIASSVVVSETEHGRERERGRHDDDDDDSCS